MLVLTRKPGESVEIVQYGVTVKIDAAGDSVGGKFVRLSINGEPTLELRKGDQLKIGDVVLCVAGFHHSKVKLGFDAPKGIKIMRTELAGAS